LRGVDLNQRPLVYELLKGVLSIRYFEGRVVQIAAQFDIARNPGATGIELQTRHHVRHWVFRWTALA
jgi:hypothetical protein